MVFPFLALFALGTGFAPGQEDPVPEALEVQSKLEQWVQTRQLISKEASAWEAEKTTLAELNEIRQREFSQLDEFITAAGERVDEIDGKRDAFSLEESDLKAWRLELEKRLSSFEEKLAPLLPRFPTPLREKVEESLLRLAAPDSEQALQNRTRDVLLVLQAYLDFQNSLTLASDVMEIAGTRREVDILYLGMTQAWYVDSGGKHSGYGIPTETGWVWTEDSVIASRVRSAIEIQSRRSTPAFVELPLAKERSKSGSESKTEAK